jgi:hypothetical protein
MAQTVTIAFSFGSSRTGLTDLRAQPLTNAGASTGSALSATFTEIGKGMYQFDSASIPDDAVAIKAYSLAASSTIVDHAAIITSTAPTAAENATATRTELATELARIDVATSTRLAAADYTAGGGGSGNGDISVDHDYGTADAYRVMNSVTGEPVDDALITAFAGTATTGTPVAQTRTGSDGRWIAPLMLDAGTYTLVISKAGVIETATATLTVTA